MHKAAQNRMKETIDFNDFLCVQNGYSEQIEQSIWIISVQAMVYYNKEKYEKM